MCRENPQKCAKMWTKDDLYEMPLLLILVGISAPKINILPTPPNSLQTASTPLYPPLPLGFSVKKPTPAPCLAPRTSPSPPPSGKFKMSETSTNLYILLRVTEVRNLEGPTREPRHASVFSTHSDTQAVPAFHCIRMFKGNFSTR